MLGVPAPTDFDLNFRLLGIPVRVNPFFWVLAAFLGWSGRSGIEVLVWIACVFVSILAHEFGHGLAARALLRQRPAVILYMLGGVCTYERNGRSPWRQMAILALGPGAGLLLFLLVAVAGTAILGIAPFGLVAVHEPPRWLMTSPATPLILEAYQDLLVINLIWSLFNLLPIFPFDGGQLTYTLFSMSNPREGPKRCFIVSIGIAAIVAVYFYQRDETYNALLVGYFGLINFQNLQAAQFQSRMGDGDDDDNWWRK